VLAQRHSLATALVNAKTAGTRFWVLGVGVDTVQIPEVVHRMEEWISERVGCRFIAVTGMHGITEAQRDPSFKQALKSAALVVPDGMPLVWLGRHHGYALQRRVYGPELLETFCRTTGSKYRHFFYGGAPGVPELLAEVLRQRFAIRVAGAYSPPFYFSPRKEKPEVLAVIQAAKPDVIWVGMSTPKQERWMYDHSQVLGAPVLIGVGAAFDFITGRTGQAPHWMQDNGLEWLFRLVKEPRRLWRRYLICGSKFVWDASLEVLGWKRFE
jgi:N-acetylglucosaminyldiphosphoundecaprenol N-acetyl-beta-D-mannosaminyltransferase